MFFVFVFLLLLVLFMLSPSEARNGAHKSSSSKQLKELDEELDLDEDLMEDDELD